MAFWRSESDMPPELKDKTPEQIVAALKAAETATTATATEKAAREAAEAASATQKTEMETMRTRMAELEANQKPPEPIVQDEPPSPWTDPEKFVDQRVQGLAGVALQSGMMTAKMYFMQNLSPRDVKIFKKYESEVEKGVNTFQPAMRVMPQSWLNMFMFVKGTHEMEIRKAETEKSDFFSETPSRGLTPEPEPEDTLNAEEQEICKTFHYDPKTYLERRKTATLSQSAKGTYVRYPVPTTGNTNR